EDDVAALGAERDLDGIGYRVDALFERLAGLRLVLQFLVCHICVSSPGTRLRLDLGQHVGLAEDEQLLAVHLDLGAAVLAVEDLVAFGDIQRGPLAGVVIYLAVADREYLALLGLLLGRIGQDEATGGGFLLLDC